MTFKCAVLLLLTAGLGACSLDHQFLKPDKFPPGFNHVNYIDPARHDTTVLTIGKNYQPSLTDAHNNPKPLKYTLESVLLKNHDGKDIVCWFAKPNTPSIPKTTILFLHGNAGNLVTEFFSYIQLAKQGFQVLALDYSGYGFSGGKATRDNLLIDGNTTLKYLAARPDVKGTKLIIYGQSMGGHLAAVLAQQNEALIDGVVMEGAPSSMDDIGAHVSKMGFIARAAIATKYSAEESIKQFHKPVLIIHSTEDEVVPLRLGRNLYASANDPKFFYEIRHAHIAGLLFHADSIVSHIKALPIAAK
jgi:pimeloyl-ACP methyl ester carboxylesterase